MLLSAILTLGIFGPIAKLLLLAPGEGLASVWQDRELLAAIGVTVLGASLAAIAVVLLGLPLAYLLARRQLPGNRMISAALQLPVIVPHPVAGIAILLFFGRQTALGAVLGKLGLEVVNHVPGLVIAMAFVSAPLFISAARQAISAVDPTLERVARTLGDTEWLAFRRVTLPLARRGLLAGVVVTWARAVSEFGAVVVVTYHPKTASVLIFDRFTTDGLRGVIPAAALLLAVAVAIVGVLTWLEPRPQS
jgi:molybdate/tungstate transport system permease protein